MVHSTAFSLPNQQEPEEKPILSAILNLLPNARILTWALHWAIEEYKTLLADLIGTILQTRQLSESVDENREMKAISAKPVLAQGYTRTPKIRIHNDIIENPYGTNTIILYRRMPITKKFDHRRYYGRSASLTSIKHCQQEVD